VFALLVQMNVIPVILIIIVQFVLVLSMSILMVTVLPVQITVSLVLLVLILKIKKLVSVLHVTMKVKRISIFFKMVTVMLHGVLTVLLVPSKEVVIHVPKNFI